ncbi:MAG: class C beta-lactamase-related serine hydrolase [Calditrichaeota bacterium]|nr:MAG: class C beta-lactamase-related serine hydrolase [Calditrichota bacterium]
MDVTQRLKMQKSLSRYFHILKFFILFSLTLPVSCSKKTVDPGPVYNFTIPEETGDGWTVASLTEVGIDEGPLTNLMTRLDETNEHNIHSLLIIKNGKLVFEKYFTGDKFNLAQYTGETGFDRSDTHNLCSATKSFTSALIGIAIEQGFIESVEQKVFDFFPEHADLLSTNPEKGNLTLNHLLTMTSGLEWDDESTSYFDPVNDMNRLFNSRNPIRFILAKDFVHSPGAVFEYKNCNTNVLGEIIKKASLMRLDTFSEDYLFSKLGITDFEWQMISADVVFCSGDLRLRPRDMAKFGYLFLNGGVWQNARIISQAWTENSIHRHNELDDYWFDSDGYGYKWWLWNDIDGVAVNAYAASGWGGQWIIILPDYDTVFVTTGGNYYTEETLSIQTLLVEYILPAVAH